MLWAHDCVVNTLHSSVLLSEERKPMSIKMSANVYKQIYFQCLQTGNNANSQGIVSEWISIF
jgi:hypothetical protein